jgi:Tol biopolymer transport system component
MPLRRLLLTLGGAAFTVAAGLLPSSGETVAVLLPAGGAPPNDASGDPGISGNGRVVAFTSRATNLVPGAGDPWRDVIVVNFPTGASECASVSTAGAKADGDSSEPALDRKGRRVAFTSLADNLVDGDGNGVPDVFVRDRKAGTTVRASVSSDGTEGDDASSHPCLSGDGRLLVFSSYATNLVPDDSNAASDVFLRDLESGTTTRVSLAHDGAQGNDGSLFPVISANGRYVAFMSYAGNLVADDENAVRDDFVRDLKTGQVEMVSVSKLGADENAPGGVVSISASGRKLLFESNANNLDPADSHIGTDIYLRDRKLHTTSLVSRAPLGLPANGDSMRPEISGNGRWAAFISHASNLVAGDGNGFTDVFLCDLKQGLTTRVSISSDGVEGNGDSSEGHLCRDGGLVVFGSRADNLVAGPTNGLGVVALHKP